MTVAGNEPQAIAAAHARTVAALAPGLAAAAALAAAPRGGGGGDGGVSTVGDLDLQTHRRAGDAATARALAPSLAAAAAAGHRATVTAGGAGGPATLTVTWSGPGRPVVDLDGPAGDLVGQGDVADLDRLASLDDAAGSLALLPDGTGCTVELVLKPPPGGAHWAPSTDGLRARLCDGRWAATLLQLTGDTTRPAVVVVQDAGTDTLLAPGFAVAGPDAPPDPPYTGDRPTPPYRTNGPRAGRPPLPAPYDLTARPGPAGTLEPLREPLDAAARACCWYWLAPHAEITSTAVHVRYDGVRTVELDLLPYAAAGTDQETALYRWASAADDPARDDAVQQAITFAVRDDADLPGAAGPVLRTARSLHELAGRGLVAEALAARRAARDAAVTAARAAAQAARDVAAKSVERTLALLLAGGLALLANGQRLLTPGAARAFVLAAGALALAALVVAERVELRSGHDLLDAFQTDAVLYREALSEDDLAALRGLSALTAAASDLQRSRLTARIVYLTVAALAVAALPLIHHPGPGRPATGPAPVSSTTPGPAAPPARPPVPNSSGRARP